MATDQRSVKRRDGKLHTIHDALQAMLDSRERNTHREEECVVRRGGGECIQCGIQTRLLPRQRCPSNLQFNSAPQKSNDRLASIQDLGIDELKVK